MNPSRLKIGTLWQVLPLVRAAPSWLLAASTDQLRSRVEVERAARIRLTRGSALGTLTGCVTGGDAEDDRPLG